MENDKDEIVDTDEVETKDEVEEETEETKEEVKETEKPKESLEDRQARLKRQLAQVNKKLGVGESTEKTKEEVKDDKLSSKDLYSLMQAKVPEEDVDDVVKAAKVLNKTIPEALKDPLLIGILKTKEEHRNSSEAQNTGKSRTATKTPTADELLKNLSKGQVPEKGSKEADDLFWAKRGGKR